MTSIVSQARSQSSFPQDLTPTALQEYLGDTEIEDICAELGHTWRCRKLPPGLTVRTCVQRALNPDHSIARLLIDVAAADPTADIPTDSAWCQARSRLPVPLLRELIYRRADTARRRFGGLYLWDGRPVFIGDGSTVSMPDEPALVEAFGYAPTKHGPSRFPVARITFLEAAGLEVIWDYRLDDYRTSEDEQFEEMWPSLPHGCICLLDRKFSSFRTLAKLRQRRIGVVTLLHQCRDPQKLIDQGRKLGPHEWRVTLELAPHWRRRYDDATLPGRLAVRLIRNRFRRGRRWHTLWVVTTLMDRTRYPRGAVARRYRQRWEIEERIGSLKATLEMNVLRSKTPQAARCEVASIVLGHNLVWLVMHEAAAGNGVAVSTMSFAGAVKVVVAFSQTLALMAVEDRAWVRGKMLGLVSLQANHHPPGRVEPRKVKRDRRRYAYLKQPRTLARQECLS